MPDMPVWPPRNSQIAEQEVERHAPGNGAQAADNGPTGAASGSPAARPPRTCVTNRLATSASQGDASQRQQPAGSPSAVVKYSRGISAQADKGGLSKRSQPAHAGQQNQSQRHQRIEPDVVEQGDVELRQNHADPAPAAATKPTISTLLAHSSSSTWRVVSERQTSTGMIRVNTITSLKADAQNEEKDSSRPTSIAPAAATG